MNETSALQGMAPPRNDDTERADLPTGTGTSAGTTPTADRVLETNTPADRYQPDGIRQADTQTPEPRVGNGESGRIDAVQVPPATVAAASQQTDEPAAVASSRPAEDWGQPPSWPSAATEPAVAAISAGTWPDVAHDPLDNFDPPEMPGGLPSEHVQLQLLAMEEDSQLGAFDDAAEPDGLPTSWPGGRGHPSEDSPPVPLVGGRPLAGLAAGPAFGEVVEGRDGWRIKPETVAQYQARVARVWRSAAEALSSDPEAAAVIKPLDVVMHLIRRGRGDPGLVPLKESSWLGYRSALLWDLSRNAHRPEYAVAQRLLEQHTHPAPADPEVLRKQRQLERRRKKAIPREDLRVLLDQLGVMNRSANWGARTQHFLMASIATGLRPGEWRHTRWAHPERKDWLLAPNTKEKADLPATVRRRAVIANSEAGAPAEDLHKEVPKQLTMRAIAIDPSNRIYVAMHMASIAASIAGGTPFEKYQEYCRQTLWRACQELWGGKKLYSLYTGRHQYHANALGSNLPASEVAAAMGHVDERSGRRHYARGKHAHKGAVVDRNTSRDTVVDRNTSRDAAAQPPLEQADSTDQPGAAPAASDAAAGDHLA